MQSLSDILRPHLHRPAPCDFCARTGPTYRDPETGSLYCLPCLEDAVAESQAEIVAERQDMAPLPLAACR